MTVAESRLSQESVSEKLNVQLDFSVTDRETAIELLKYEDIPSRTQFAKSALKVGVLAIRQACGVIDSQSIQEECQKFIETVGGTLSSHTEVISTQVGNMLARFFDPSNGEFPQRIDRLIRRDGELESLFGKHLNGESSTLTATLEKHLGSSSPLMQLLSPEQRNGFHSTLKEALELALGQHSKSIVNQFSLDDKESALSRLVTEITEKNGGLRSDLEKDLDKIRKEFSLDNKDGALSRLVQRVEGANLTILREFSVDNEQSALNKMAKLLEVTNNTVSASLSLDTENSPLSRMKREILNVIEDMNKGNLEFQKQVDLSLQSMKVTRAEASRTTAHGLEFENVLGGFLQREFQKLGDVFEQTKDNPGAIPRCKIGDFVITMGPESAAPDARIVIEAKEDRSYKLKDALGEIQKARENRQSQVGIFVFSKESAPEGLESLTRHNRDIVLVWDAADPQTDIVLRAGISVARMIVIRESKLSEQKTTDIMEMTASIDAIIREVNVLDEIIRFANTALNNCEKIISKSGVLKKKVDKHLSDLQDHVQALGSTEAN